MEKEQKAKVELYVEDIKSLSTTTINNQNNDLNRRLESELLNKDFISMEDIQKRITPIIFDCDIFISYSHNDINVAKQVANELKANGYKVFIDCLYWGSIDKALKIYDDKNKNDNDLYNYEKRNKSTATFHMILVDSIIDMIRKSKAFVFLRGKDVDNKNFTLSPWLYLENKIANDYKNELTITHQILENKMKFSINFPLNTQDFYNCSSILDLTSTLRRINNKTSKDI